MSIYKMLLGTLIVGLGMLVAVDARANVAPAFTPVSSQFVEENNMLIIDVTATDVDGDHITLAAIDRPFGSIFVDNGDGSGQLSWKPDFVGPNSSDGSPFGVTFWAGDGQTSTVISTEVVVINKNRYPILSAPDTVSIIAGGEISFEVSGSDPDFDSLGWLMLDIPEGLNFDSRNPGTLNWSTGYSDSGYHNVKIGLEDQLGAIDTADVVLNIRSAMVYVMSIGNDSVFPGEVANISIGLENLEPVSGFDIVINHDVSVLTYSAINWAGTRISHFEYLSYRLNYRGFLGDIQIVGYADLNDGSISDNLDIGSGTIVDLSFFVTSDLSYAGYSVPLTFAFRDEITGNDNTLTDPDSVRIDKEVIDYTDGYIKIKSSSPSSLGDINLNGVNYEIADIVVFTNFFISPVLWPFTPIMWLNSDVNHDGTGATIADLVLMINVLLNSITPSSKQTPVIGEVVLSIEHETNGQGFYYESAVELGGISVVLESAGAEYSNIELSSELSQKGMTVKSSIEAGTVRLLIYSEDGQTMPNGANQLFEIRGGSEFIIREIQASTTDGQLIDVVFRERQESLLPDGFALYQNYPNPFNPTTALVFDLPVATEVRMSVYNILGQEVKRLVNDHLPAGSHTIIWDGRDNLGTAVSSGIYFYKLSAESFMAEKKMILLK